VDADIASNISNRTISVEDERYRLLFVLLRKTTACLTHFQNSP
jgi:hypothetical protein